MGEMIFLGAGASVEAGVPHAIQMTRNISRAFRDSPEYRRFYKLVTFVVGGLVFNKGIQGEDPLESGVNVEELFNAIRLLADRNSSEAAPFIGSWHSLIDEFDTIEPPEPQLSRLHSVIYQSIVKQIVNAFPNSLPGFGRDRIDRKIQGAIAQDSRFSFGRSDVGTEIGKYVQEIVRKWLNGIQQTPANTSQFVLELRSALDRTPRPGRGQIFDEVSKIMIQMLVEIVWINELEKTAYLQPLLNLLVSNDAKLTIATLNYDNSIELLLEGVGKHFSTGVNVGTPAVDLSFSDSPIKVIKLHGSIDWVWEGVEGNDSRMPYKSVRRVPKQDLKIEGFTPALIFGHKNKLTADGPFLALLREFGNELEQASLLTVVGYSFADPHINTFIAGWLNGDPERIMRIIDPGFMTNTGTFAKELRSRCMNRIDMVPLNAGEGLLKVFGTYVMQNAAEVG